MARIQKGFALSVAILGFFSFLFGLGLAIASWILSSKFNNISISDNYYSGSNTSFASYWWGGLFYCIPGILGMIAGCSKNSCVMVFYLIFNILCLISSLAVSVLVSIILVFWSVINKMLRDSDCQDKSSFDQTYCSCGNDLDIHYDINNTTCSNVMGVSSALAAILATAIISSFLAFIASYVSCCSLCHQENEQFGTVIIQPGAGTYQPPPTMFVNTQTQQQQYAPPPYAYNHSSSFAVQPPTHDKAQLVKNEV